MWINVAVLLAGVLLLLGIASSKFSARLGVPVLVLFLRAHRSWRSCWPPLRWAAGTIAAPAASSLWSCGRRSITATA